MSLIFQKTVILITIFQNSVILRILHFYHKNKISMIFKISDICTCTNANASSTSANGTCTTTSAYCTSAMFTSAISTSTTSTGAVAPALGAAPAPAALLQVGPHPGPSGQGAQY